MTPPEFLFSKLNFTRGDVVASGISQFVFDHAATLFRTVKSPEPWFKSWLTNAFGGLYRLNFLAGIFGWATTFTFLQGILYLGFGPKGIVAGSLAAEFQSFMYGAFTPAGSIFAWLQSMAMRRRFMFPAVIISSMLTIVATTFAARFTAIFAWVPVPGWWETDWAKNITMRALNSNI